MKIKVGNRIISSKDEPIMVILSDVDKYNIAHMTSQAYRYAAFPDNWDPNKTKEWMDITDENK